MLKQYSHWFLYYVEWRCFSYVSSWPTLGMVPMDSHGPILWFWMGLIRLGYPSNRLWFSKRKGQIYWRLYKTPMWSTHTWSECKRQGNLDVRGRKILHWIFKKVHKIFGIQNINALHSRYRNSDRYSSKTSWRIHVTSCQASTFLIDKK